MKKSGLRGIIVVFTVFVFLVSPITVSYSNGNFTVEESQVEAATYPTKWIKLRDNVNRTKRLSRAVDGAVKGFVIGLLPWNIAGTSVINALAGGIYDYVNFKGKNVYFTLTYEYRQLKKATQKSDGTWNGNFEVRETTYAYKDSARKKLIKKVVKTKKVDSLTVWLNS